LPRDGQRLGQRHRTGERRPLDVLHHQIVRSHVVQRTNVGMIQRGDSSRFPLEALAKLLGADLDGYHTTEARVARFVHFAHATSADGSDYFVGTESSSV